MTARGLVDHSDLGLLVLQHWQPDIEEGRRHCVAAARLLEIPNPKRSTDPRSSSRIVATERGMGTIGDFHPMRFWQCADRHARASGSWANVFQAVGTDGGTGGYGRNGTGHPVSSLELYPVRDSEGRADKRYFRTPLVWPPNFAAVPRGTMLGALAGTDERSQQDAALWADPRLFAPSTSGPAECGTLVVDLQPDAEPCMDRTSSPGVGGRSARLQGFVRVVAMPERGSPLERLGASPGNVLAWNGALSRQDGLPGLGAVWLELSGAGVPGPSTGHPGTPPGPITTSGRPAGAPPPAGSPPPEFQGESAAAGAGGAGGGGSRTSSGGAEEPLRWRDWGKFEAKPQTRHGLGLFAALRSYGPLHAGSGTCQHRAGFDRDGHPISSGHLATGALWFLRDDRDGPLRFLDEDAKRPGPLPLRTRVHLVWDRELFHPWIDGQKRGKWVFEGEAPLVIPDDGDEPPDDPVPPPRTPSTGTPTTPGGPRQPGGGPPGGGPTTGGGPGEGAPPGGGTPNPRRPDQVVFEIGPRNPPGPFNPGPSGGNGGPESGGFGGGGDTPGGATLPDSDEPPGPTTPSEDPNEKKPPAPPPDPEITEWLEQQRRRRRQRPRLAPAPRDISPAIGWTKLRDVGEVERGDRALFVIHHPLHESFAATSWRPQLWVRGAPHFERANDLDANRFRNDEARRPHVLTARAWGAQNANEGWQYAEDPHVSRARGGIAAGGVVFAPPHLEGEDLFDVGGAVSPLTSPTAAAVLLAPEVSLAFGLPMLDGGLRAGALRWRQLATSSRAPLVLEQLDAARAPVELLRAEVDGATAEAVVSLAGAQAVRIPRGEIAERPSAIAAAGGMVRIATDLEEGIDELEFRDAQLSRWRGVHDLEAALVRARRSQLYILDGFSGQAAHANPWTQTAIAGGTIAAHTTVADLEHHPGIHRVSSAVAGNSGWRTHFFATAPLVCSGLGGSITELIFRVVSSSGFRLIFGFHNETGVALPASGVFVYCDGTTFSGYCANAGDRTQTSTTYTLATDKWYRARVALNATGDAASFFLSEMSGDPVWSGDVADDYPAAVAVNHGWTFGRTTAGVTAMADFDLMTLALHASRE